MEQRFSICAMTPRVKQVLLLNQGLGADASNLVSISREFILEFGPGRQPSHGGTLRKREQGKRADDSWSQRIDLPVRA